MPSFFTHILYTIGIVILFSVFTIGMDLDHFFKCNAKGLLIAGVNPDKGYKLLDEIGSKDCRGFAHSWRFGIVIIILALAWIFHMFLDYVLYPTKAQPFLPF